MLISPFFLGSYSCRTHEISLKEICSQNFMLCFFIPRPPTPPGKKWEEKTVVFWESSTEEA